MSTHRVVGGGPWRPAKLRCHSTQCPGTSPSQDARSPAHFKAEEPLHRRADEQQMENERAALDGGRMHCAKQTQAGRERPGGPGPLVPPHISHPSWARRGPAPWQILPASSPSAVEASPSRASEPPAPGLRSLSHWITDKQHEPVQTYSP